MNLIRNKVSVSGQKLVFGFAVLGLTALVGSASVAAHQEQPTNGAPTSKDQCKNGGWQSYGFSNQGHCVSYVARQGQGSGYGNSGNNNDVSITNSSSQSSSSGNASSNNNANGGNASSGNASNSNATSNDVTVTNY